MCDTFLTVLFGQIAIFYEKIFIFVMLSEFLNSLNIL